MSLTGLRWNVRFWPVCKLKLCPQTLFFTSDNISFIMALSVNDRFLLPLLLLHCYSLAAGRSNSTAGGHTP